MKKKARKIYMRDSSFPSLQICASPILFEVRFSSMLIGKMSALLVTVTAE